MKEHRLTKLLTLIISSTLSSLVGIPDIDFTVSTEKCTVPSNEVEEDILMLKGRSRFVYFKVVPSNQISEEVLAIDSGLHSSGENGESDSTCIIL